MTGVARSLLSAIIAATAAAVVFGSAATIGGLGGTQLGAGGAAVSVCDSDGVTTSYTSSAGHVTNVTVDGIADPGCEGGELSLTLTAAGASVGSGGPQTIATDAGTTDNSAVVPVSPQPAAPQVDGIHVVIVGP